LNPRSRVKDNVFSQPPIQQLPFRGQNLFLWDRDAGPSPRYRLRSYNIICPVLIRSGDPERRIRHGWSKISGSTVLAQKAVVEELEDVAVAAGMSSLVAPDAASPDCCGCLGADSGQSASALAASRLAPQFVEVWYAHCVHSLALSAIPARREYRGRAGSARITRADERWLLRSNNDRAGRRSCCQGARRFRLPRHASYIGVFRAPPGTGKASRSGSWLHIGVLGSWVISDGAKLVHLISPCPLPLR
jgi:hypothetical protein